MAELILRIFGIELSTVVQRQAQDEPEVEEDLALGPAYAPQHVDFPDEHYQPHFGFLGGR